MTFRTACGWVAVGVLGAAVLTLDGAAFQSPAVAPSATPDRLLQAQDLTYAGAFRLPVGATEQETFAYGGTALAYVPAHDSLLVVGHDWYQKVAEVSIPRLTKNTIHATDLASGAFRQPFKDVLDGGIRRIGEGTAKVGGLLPWGDGLIATAYLYYDGTGTQSLSHYRASLDFARPGSAQGPFKVGSLGAGFVSGAMTPIPAEWQAALGGPALTGQCCLSIISRTSLGPAVSVFDPADVGVKPLVPATQVLGYPITHPTLGTCESTGELFNCASSMGGFVFPDGTRSVLFFGRVGSGKYCYGLGVAGTPIANPAHGQEECVDPTQGSKGPHAFPYAYTVFAYDVLDLVAVKNRQKAAWDVRPYKTWTFEMPFQRAARTINAAAYDPKSRRIFLSAAFNDGERPLIHVLTVAR